MEQVGLTNEAIILKVSQNEELKMKSLNGACLFAYEVYLILPANNELEDPKSLPDIQRSIRKSKYLIFLSIVPSLTIHFFFTKEDYLLFIHFVNGLTATDRQIKIVEEPDLDSKKLQDLSLQNSGSNVSLSNSTKLEERPNDNGSSCEDSRNNMNFSSSIASKKRNQEVSRKGNGMGVSGWKSQFCMNGITFCFKVGTLLRATGMFSHIKRLYC